MGAGGGGGGGGISRIGGSSRKLCTRLMSAVRRLFEDCATKKDGLML